MVAIDAQGNVSATSKAVTARAVDTAPPTPSHLSLQWNSGEIPAAQILWISSDESQLERCLAGNTGWVRVTDWLPSGSHQITDLVDSANAWWYRLKVRKYTGAIATSQIFELVAQSIDEGA